MGRGPPLGRSRPRGASILDAGRGRGDNQLKSPRRRRRRSAPSDGTAHSPPPPAPETGSARAQRARRMKTEHHRSAGGLIVYNERLLLIATQKGKRWQLPKGHIEEGETPEQAAIREVQEETGVTGRIVAPLPGVEYWFIEKGPRRIHKKVDYFLLDYVSGDSVNFDPEEVSGTGWFSWETGIARLTFENERKVARRAREILEPEGVSEPEQTGTED